MGQYNALADKVDMLRISQNQFAMWFAQCKFSVILRKRPIWFLAESGKFSDDLTFSERLEMK